MIHDWHDHDDLHPTLLVAIQWRIHEAQGAMPQTSDSTKFTPGIPTIYYFIYIFFKYINYYSRIPYNYSLLATMCCSERLRGIS